MFVCTFVLLSACTTLTQTNQPSTIDQGDVAMSSKTLQIYFFDPKVIGNLGKTQEAVSSALNTIDLSTSVYTATETDLVEYNWTTQRITIKNTWKTQNEELPAWVQYAGYFVVVFDGERLFSGRTARYGTAAPIDFPVMLYDGVTSLMNDSAELIFFFRASSDPLIEPPFPFLANDPSVAAAVRAHLQAIGKLQE